MIISVSEGARSMIESSGVVATQTRYELRFANLFNRGRGYAFPCDAQGRVNIDELTNHARNNYLFARAVVGTELSVPTVSPAGGGSGPVRRHACLDRWLIQA